MRVQRTRSGARTLLAAFVLVAFTGPVQLATSQPVDDVRKALARFIDAFNNLDWEAFHGWIAADATLFNPEIPEATDLRRLDGKEEVERSFRSVFEATKRSASGPPYLHIVPRNVRVQMLDRAAVVTFEFDRGKGSIGRHVGLSEAGRGLEDNSCPCLEYVSWRVGRRAMARRSERGPYVRWFGAFIVLPLAVWFEAARRAGFRGKSLSNLTLEPLVVAVASSLLFAGWFLLAKGRLRPLVGILLLLILAAGAIAVQLYVPGLRE